MKVLPDARCVYHLYVVEVDDRENLIKEFKNQGISCGMHYPVPMNLQPACGALGYEKGSFPVSEAASRRVLSLPLYPELSDQAIDRIGAIL